MLDCSLLTVRSLFLFFFWAFVRHPLPVQRLDVGYFDSLHHMHWGGCFLGGVLGMDTQIFFAGAFFLCRILVFCACEHEASLCNSCSCHWSTFVANFWQTRYLRHLIFFLISNAHGTGLETRWDRIAGMVLIGISVTLLSFGWVRPLVLISFFIDIGHGLVQARSFLWATSANSSPGSFHSDAASPTCTYLNYILYF